MRGIRALLMLWLSKPRCEVSEPCPISTVRSDNGCLRRVEVNGKTLYFYRYRRHNKDRSISIIPQLIPTVERAIKQGLSSQAILSIYRSELRKIRPDSRQLRG